MTLKLEVEELSEAVILIFANKQDLPQAITTAELVDKFKILNQFEGRKWLIQPTSAIQGCGLYEGLDWLSKELSRL